LKVNAVLVTEGVNIKRQIYIAFIIDRVSQRPAFVFCKEGGIDIEEVYKSNPSAINVVSFDPSKGISEE